MRMEQSYLNTQWSVPQKTGDTRYAILAIHTNYIHSCECFKFPSQIPLRIHTYNQACNAAQNHKHKSKNTK